MKTRQKVRCFGARAVTCYSQPTSLRPAQVAGLARTQLHQTTAPLLLPRGIAWALEAVLTCRSLAKQLTAGRNLFSALLSTLAYCLVQAIALWVEKTAPFLLLLSVVFAYTHIRGKCLCRLRVPLFTIQADAPLPSAGITVFTRISLVLYRANEALKKQVSLKQDYSRLQCMSLAAALMGHVLLIMLCLHQERLWLRFLFATPSPVPEVSRDKGTGHVECQQMILLLSPRHSFIRQSWCCDISS